MYNLLSCVTLHRIVVNEEPGGIYESNHNINLDRLRKLKKNKIIFTYCSQPGYESKYKPDAVP